jgi:glycosyltransferase involved in cell wall biosynthesis
MGGQQNKGVGSVMRVVAERGLEDRVRFAGFMDLSAKQREFAGHDIFLNTNRVDNTPVSVIEACAFGLPVVATRVGGIPYLLEDGTTALLVGDEDVDAMTAAVFRLCEEPGLSDRLSVNGRHLAESCAWNVVKSRWDAVFARVLADG